jgi:hypothetical protein
MEVKLRCTWVQHSASGVLLCSALVRPLLETSLPVSFLRMQHFTVGPAVSKEPFMQVKTERTWVQHSACRMCTSINEAQVDAHLFSTLHATCWSTWKKCKRQELQHASLVKALIFNCFKHQSFKYLVGVHFSSSLSKLECTWVQHSACLFSRQGGCLSPLQKCYMSSKGSCQCSLKGPMFSRKTPPLKVGGAV